MDGGGSGGEVSRIPQVVTGKVNRRALAASCGDVGGRPMILMTNMLSQKTSSDSILTFS